MKYINSNLITLKCVLFLFFGGLGCLYPFLPLHMTEKNLSDHEKFVVSLVAPCVALIGPAIAGPLADKLAGGSGGKPRSKSGMYLRVMIALCFILSAILYWLLLVVPATESCKISTIDSLHWHCDNSQNLPRDNKNFTVHSEHTNLIRLQCNGTSGRIEVEKCLSGKPCAYWDTDVIATLDVQNCTYTCEDDSHVHPTTSHPEQDTSASAVDYESNYDENNIGSGEGPTEVDAGSKTPVIVSHVPNPHICYSNGTNGTYCHVYSTHSKPINLQVSLEHLEDTSNDLGICTYPIKGDFHCRMGPKFEENQTIDLSTCNPTIKCAVSHSVDPKADEVFVETACSINTSSFGLYLLIRSIADIFPVTAVALLDAAIIIATRETSTGRGDAGKQFAVGALGFGIFAPIVGAIYSPVAALSIFTVFMIVGALILIFDNNMPLSPPEWWWHTRCGLLALPMSSIRKYSLETAGLGLVLLLLGVFWNGIDPFLPWHIVDMNGNALDIGLTITVGALPAVLFLIYIEKILDYCGHTNLLIAAFTFYIIHYSALSVIHSPGLLLLCEALEIFTLHVTWVTAVLYLRHLVARKFTVSGQALPVIMHFCIGRVIGALLGSFAYPRTEKKVRNVYEYFAVGATIVAIIYFLLYHLYLKPKCAAPIAEIERPSPALIQSVNGNGAYTPLRVYHNGKAKKGQFKY